MYNTRSDLIIPFSRLAKTHFFISRYGPILWNKLDSKVKKNQ